jgi:hypothetical protein
VNRFAVQDTDPQIAILWDIFEGEDRLPHRAFLGLDLKVRFDLPQLRLKVFRGPLSPMETRPLLRFVRRENVKHYRHLLAQTTDEAERQRIMKLLAEEEKKQRDADDNAEKPVAKREVTLYDDTH